MLILTRKENESVVLTIDLDSSADIPLQAPITIRLFDIRSGQARLSIDAPDNVHVARSELIAE